MWLMATDGVGQHRSRAAWRARRSAVKKAGETTEALRGSRLAQNLLIPRPALSSLHLPWFLQRRNSALGRAGPRYGCVGCLGSLERQVRMQRLWWV